MNKKMNIFLIFSDEETEKEYIKWRLPSKSIQIRVISFLTAILYLIVFQIDRVVASGYALEIMTIFHLFLVPILLLTVTFLSFWERFYNKMNLLLLVSPVVAIIGNLLVVNYVPDYKMYLPEIYLVIIWTLTISGLRLFHAILSVTCTILLTFIFLYHIPSEVFLMHLFWIFASLSFGLASAYIFEELNKKNFLHHKKLKSLATTDSLTGLFNRAKLKDVVENEISRSQRYKHTFGLAIIDIDHFKIVNDNYGHQSGDRVLVEISELVKNSLRVTDKLFRWGGEEFVIVCPQTDKDGLTMLVENIRKKVEEHIFKEIGSITVSIGFTIYEEKNNEISLVKKADEALYIAKNGGRNRTEFI